MMSKFSIVIKCASIALLFSLTTFLHQAVFPMDTRLWEAGFENIEIGIKSGTLGSNKIDKVASNIFDFLMGEECSDPKNITTCSEVTKEQLKILLGEPFIRFYRLEKLYEEEEGNDAELRRFFIEFKIKNPTPFEFALLFKIAYENILGRPYNSFNKKLKEFAEFATANDPSIDLSSEVKVLRTKYILRSDSVPFIDESPREIMFSLQEILESL